jgi:hypothetical protein
VDELIQFVQNDFLDASGKVPYRYWSEKNQKRLAFLKSSIDGGRQNLAAALSSGNLYVLIEMESGMPLTST